MAGSHFYDAEIMLCFQTQQGERDSYMIIQITLRIKYSVFLGKNSSNQFFGGSFSISPCDTDDSCSYLTAMVIS